ncbi:MAG: alkaline phosphatase family protein [Chloroflexota bacterium]
MSSILAFFRRRQNLPVLIIPLLLLIWGRFVAPELGEASFSAVALFDSPYLAPLPQGAPVEPSSESVAEHVVIVVIDGLREDVSHQMPTINALREQGADRVITVGQPSFSLPGWTVIGTGAWQEQSGITTNFTTASIAVDTIFESAKRAGLTTALVGSEGWGQLYTTGIDDQRLLAEHEDAYTNLEGDLQYDQEIGDLALEVLAEQENLTLIHLLSVDSAAHGWGALSPEEQQAVQNADVQLARILAAVNLENTALVVTADHGHIDAGGHGGWEATVLHIPLVSAGQGILPGAYPLGTQADIAPTVATLLGAAIPAHNQGAILFDQLDTSDALKAARAVELARQITLRYDAMLVTIGDSRQIDTTTIAQAHDALLANDNAGALALSQQVFDSAHLLWDTARADRINRERLQHLPIALLLLVPVVLYFIWWRRERWNWRAPLIGTVIYFVVWNAIYFVIHRFTYSISMFNVESNTVSFITGRVIEALIALTIAVIVVALLRRNAARGEIARDAVHTMLLVAVALGVQILIYAVIWEIMPSWYLPDLQAAFKYYLDLYQTTAFWPLLPVPLAAVLPLLALLVAAVARRLMPGRK